MSIDENYQNNNNNNNDNNFKTNKEDFLIEKWEDLNCDLKLIRGIYAYGFENPSSIQKKAILPLITQKDIIAQAQSGTGKTGCFVIGALKLIDYNINETQIIIMAPTRELAQQIKMVCSK